MAKEKIISGKMKQIAKNIPRQLLMLPLPVAFFILVLTIRTPFPIRAISQATRYGITIVIPSLLILFFIFFRIKGWWGRVLSLTFTVTVFGLSLAGLWSKGQSEYYILSGLIPIIDASSFFGDAQRLLEGFPLTAFSAWRPLFPAMLSGVYAFSGMNLQITQAVLVAVTAVSCFILAVEIQRTHGAVAAAFTITILFLYYRILSGALMAENLGLSLGALGLAVLWRGAAGRNTTDIFFGIMLVSLALLSRHGTYLILPALVIWAGWLIRGQRRFSWRTFALAFSAVLTGMVIYLAATLFYSGQIRTPYSNYSTIFYDFSSGFPEKHGWISSVHPEVLHLPEPQRSQKVYKLSLEEIWHNPYDTMKGVLEQWLYFFGFGWYAVYGYLVSGTPIITRILYVGMYVLCLATIFNWFRNPGNAHLALVVFSFLAIVLSVPFVPPYLHNRVRMYASTYPFLAVLPALGLAWFFKAFKLATFNKSPDGDSRSRIAAWTGVGLVIFTLFSPIIACTFIKPASYEKIQCPDGEEVIYFRYTLGSQINILNEYVMQMDWVPDIHNGRFTAYMHSMPHYGLIDELEANLHPPATILSVLDLGSGVAYLLIGETSLFLNKTGEILGACGMSSQDPRVVDHHIFYASSVNMVEK